MRRKPVLVFRHVAREPLGLLAPALRRAGLSYVYADMWRRKTRLPAVRRIGALVIMGGPMGVYEKERYPFLLKELDYIRRTIEAGKPLLGICLGAQLIAHALGARVYPNRRKEIGWYPVSFKRAGRRDPLLKDIAQRPLRFFQWHGDTFDLPRGATLLASTRLCRNQAFRYRKNVFALQFHPEVDPALVDRWLREPDAAREIRRAGAQPPALIRKRCRHLYPAARGSADEIFRNFSGLIKGDRHARR